MLGDSGKNPIVLRKKLLKFNYKRFRNFSEDEVSCRDTCFIGKKIKLGVYAKTKRFTGMKMTMTKVLIIANVDFINADGN